MCGVAGIVSYNQNAPDIDQRELLRIRDQMVHRGPDDAGLWIAENHRTGLAHRRLAIIDPGPTGHQPMHREHLSITFNGEIYNFRTLRLSLEKQGYQFHSQSDTEVLLALYQSRGINMMHDLVGMFAMAIWDAKASKLILARDPYGIKPLYYCDDGKQLKFASEVKALLAGNKVSKEADPAGEIGFLMLGSVPEPRTYYSAISALPAGSTMEISLSGSKEVKQYASITQSWSNALAGETKDDGFTIAENFKHSVERHLVSDVPVGVFLSAGIDSGAISGLMAEQVDKVDSITLGFEEFVGTENDETILAGEVAEYYGTAHSTRLVSQSELNQDFEKILMAMDQPTIDGLNTWFISKAAAEKGIKVMLSGLGGDELLGSYPSFHRIPLWNRYLKWSNCFPGLGSMTTGLGKFMPYNRPHPKFWGLFKYGGKLSSGYFLDRGLFMPWELPELIEHDRLDQGLKLLGFFDQLESLVPEQELKTSVSHENYCHAAISSLESSLYMRNQLLRDTDWTSMAHSVEVRTPLADFQLLNSIAPKLLNLKQLNSKSCLARAPQKPLPEHIINRRKTGFDVPLGKWIESTLNLDYWKSVPMLSNSRCHHSRRYAYALFALHGELN